MGVSLKGISQKIDSDKDSGFGLDSGLLYQVPQSANLRVGVVLADLLGAKIREDRIPLKLRLGIASKFFSDRLMLTMGADWISERSVKGHFGAEYNLLRDLLLRAGYSTDNQELSAGLGFKVKHFNIIDYAYGSSDDLGGNHRVSLGVGF